MYQHIQWKCAQLAITIQPYIAICWQFQTILQDTNDHGTSKGNAKWRREAMFFVAENVVSGLIMNSFDKWNMLGSSIDVYIYICIYVSQTKNVPCNCAS